MGKKQKFIDFVKNELFEKINLNDVDEDIVEYWNLLTASEAEKPLFTDNGKLILQYLKDHTADLPMAKARDIAEGLFISSRTVSGAIRKLVNDGYVERLSKDPVIYAITEKGKTVEII